MKEDPLTESREMAMWFCDDPNLCQQRRSSASGLIIHVHRLPRIGCTVVQTLASFGYNPVAGSYALKVQRAKWAWGRGKKLFRQEVERLNNA